MADGKLEFDTELNTHGMNTELEKMGAKAEKATGKFSGLKTAAGKLGDSLKKVAKFAGEALIGISTGILGAGTASANVGMGFEAAMSKVGAISNASADDMDKLNEKAKEMGATTKFSASESAEAFQYMAMAGWNTEKMLGGIDGIMNLAAADGLDLATTSDIVTDALTAFGMSADDSSHFADVLATASSSANTNVSMLGESFKYVAPLAGAMGYSAEDVSLALGLMANASVKGSMAGTSLKTAIANLSSPTKAMKSEMDKLGISMTDSDGNALSLRDTILQLREKFKGLSESEKTAAASTIFGKEAMSGMLAIINASDEDFNNLVTNIDSADGAAKRMADTLNDNLAGDITIAKSALEGFGIAVYDNINDKLRDAVKLGTDYIGRLTDAFSKGGLQGAVDEAGELFGDLTTRIAEQAPGMIDAAVKFIESFGTALWGNRDKLFEAAKKIVSNIKGKLIELLPTSVREPIKKVIDNVGATLGALVDTFKSVFTGEGISNAVAFAVELISKITSTINNIIKKVLPAFKTGFERLQKAFGSEGFKRAVDLVSDLIGGFAQALADIASKIIPPLCDALGWVIENLDILLPLIGTAAGAFGAWKVINNATEWCGKFADKAGSVIERLTGIGTEAGGAEGAAGNLITKLLSFPGGQIALLVGTAISALAVLTTYLVTNDDKARAVADALNSMQKSAEKNLESAQTVADRFAIVGKAADEFKEKIDNASGSIHDLDSQIDKERSTKLAGEMEELQKQFNDIAGLYSNERKKLTDEEITKLEELFAKMRETADQELKVEMSYQEVEMGLAESWVTDFAGNAQEYADQSAEHLKRAAEARDNARKSEELLYKNELANINRMYANPIEAKEHREEAKRVHEKRLADIQAFYNDTVDTVRNGFEKTSTAWNEFKTESNHVYGELIDARRRYEKQIELSAGYGEHAQEMRLNAQTIYNQKTKKAWEDFAKNFDEAKAKELGIWLQMVKNNQDCGEQLDQDTANTIEFFLHTVAQLPPETQKSMSETVALAESILAPLPENMKKKAGEVSNAWSNGISDMPVKTAKETEKIKQAISDNVGEIPEKCLELGQKLATAYADGISSSESTEEIKKAAEEIKNVIRMSLIADTDVKGAAGELGRMVAQGYVDGALSQISTISGVGRLLAGSVLGGIKSGQKSNSPSKAARELGGDLSEGYYLGISDNTQKVNSRAADMAGAAVDTIRAMGQRISSMTESARLETGFAAQLKAAALAQSYGVSALLPSGSVRVSAGQSDGGKLVASGNIQTHIDIDGREFAVVTAPYMTEELAFIRG